MDFGDAPEEAAFRGRLRAWLQDNNPGLPTSSTDDDYWKGAAAWHRSLFDAGFFGMSWPTAIGGQGLPPVYDVIVDEELAAAGTPPRPSLGPVTPMTPIGVSSSLAPTTRWPSTAASPPSWRRWINPASSSGRSA
jgi:alkylation response protein AidB-like acyl-CoA dehydrogenase